jgi:hypothetical protein
MPNNEKPAEAKPQGVEQVHSEETRRQQKPQLWKPGQSGNPAGRPKGARNKLAERAIEDILTTWQEGGIEALRRVRDTEPAKYISAVISLLPKKIEADAEIRVQVTSSVDSLINRLDALAKRDAEYEADREAAIKTIEHDDAERAPITKLLHDKLGQKA